MQWSSLHLLRDVGEAPEPGTRECPREESTIRLVGDSPTSRRSTSTADASGPGTGSSSGRFSRPGAGARVGHNNGAGGTRLGRARQEVGEEQGLFPGQLESRGTVRVDFLAGGDASQAAGGFMTGMEEENALTREKGRAVGRRSGRVRGILRGQRIPRRPVGGGEGSAARATAGLLPFHRSPCHTRTVRLFASLPTRLLE